MEEALKYRKEIDLPKVHATIAEWIEEFPLEWRRETRKRYLLEAIKTTKASLLNAVRMITKYDENKSVWDMFYVWWAEQYIESLSKKLKRLSWEAKVFVGSTDAISPEKIERACEFPIEDIIEVRGRMAVCPFHNDTNPSMDVKNNFYNCYTCGAHGSVIDLVMKLENLTFRQAVDKLSYGL